MPELKRVKAATLLELLVHELFDHRDSIELVTKVRKRVAEALGAQWSVAHAHGEGTLSDLHQVVGDAEVSGVMQSLGFGEETSDQRLQVRANASASGLCLQLPQHTTLVLAFGPIAEGRREASREILETVGRYLGARLQDNLEAQRAYLANKALQRRISDLSLLFKGLDVTLSSVELTKVLRAFLTCVTSGEAIGFNRAFLLLLDEDAQELRGAVAVGPSSGDEARAIWNQLDQEHVSLEEVLRRAIEDPDPEPQPGSLDDRIRSYALPLDPAGSVLVRAATSDGIYNIHVYRGEDEEPFAEAFGAKEFVVIPILGRERTLGVIVADNLYSGKLLNMDRVYLLSGLANHVGVVIENALMFEDVSSRYAELNEVQYINRALLSSTGYLEVLRQIAQISASMLQASGTLLFWSEGDPPRPRLEMQYNALGPPLSEEVVQRCTELAHETLERNAGVLEFDLEPGSDDPEAHLAANLVSAPMAIDNEVVGALVVYRSQDHRGGARRFERHGKRILSIIADQAAIAVLSGRHLQTIQDDQSQIERLNELLYRNEKLAALGQAASQIAHEIRNPLTALGGFARRMMRSPNLDARDREAVDVIVHETERLERILNDQLDFVRSARLKRKPTLLNDVVHQSLDLLRHIVGGKNVAVELELDPQLVHASLDGDRIKQVLVNLLMNALSAVQHNGSVRVTTHTVGDYVQVDVVNDGDLIPANVKDTLFEPFATTRPKGTGLGLVVVHQIVTEHGGRIEVESTEETGTVFTIQFPVRAPSSR